MDMRKTGEFIRERRKLLELSQQALGEKVNVTDKAVSKWERGLACPDIETLKGLSMLFGCSIADILDGRQASLSAQCMNLPEKQPAEAEEMKEPEKDVEVTLDYASAKYVSPLLFCDNLEHTRACINGGLSAQMLKNRKFVGKPGRYGCANGWYPIGEKTYFFFRAANRSVRMDAKVKQTNTTVQIIQRLFVLPPPASSPSVWKIAPTAKPAI